MEQTIDNNRTSELQNLIWKHLGHIDFPPECVDEFLKVAAVRYEPGSPILKDFRDFVAKPALQYQLALAGTHPPKLKQEFDYLAGITLRFYIREQSLPLAFRQYLETVHQRLTNSRLCLHNTELIAAENEMLRCLQHKRLLLLLADLLFVLSFGWMTKNCLNRWGYLSRRDRRKLLNIWLFYPEVICRHYEIVQLLNRKIW